MKALDAKFRQAIRERDGYCCQYPHCAGEWPRHLEVSHFIGRSHGSVRWDPENCDLLCANCHQMLTLAKPKYITWKKAQLGDDRYYALLKRGAEIGKPTAAQVLETIERMKCY